MGDELQRDIQDPTSAFQMLLKYSPSALEHLFDRCLMRPVDLELQGKTYFDFFLFAPRDGVLHGDSELAIVATLVEAGRSKYLIHPLFDLFTRLKWMKICTAFHSILTIVLLYQITLFLYSLQRFSLLNQLVPARLS